MTTEPRAWDSGDPEPDGVTHVQDYTSDSSDWDINADWFLTFDGDWKGYKDGGKAYLSWAELVRRWGPVTEVPTVPVIGYNPADPKGTT